jgi:hypothetical protein
MKITQTDSARRYKLAMIISTVGGGFLLLLGVGGNVMELPGFHGVLPWALLWVGTAWLAFGYRFHRLYLSSLK